MNFSKEQNELIKETIRNVSKHEKNPNIYTICGTARRYPSLTKDELIEVCSSNTQKQPLDKKDRLLIKEAKANCTFKNKVHISTEDQSKYNSIKRKLIVHVRNMHNSNIFKTTHSFIAKEEDFPGIISNLTNQGLKIKKVWVR